jgi:hypothetical protein
MHASFFDTIQVHPCRSSCMMDTHSIGVFWEKGILHRILQYYEYPSTHREDGKLIQQLKTLVMKRIPPERELQIFLLISFRGLAKKTRGKTRWKNGKITEFGPFKFFNTENWETLEIYMNQEIMASLFSFEYDNHGAIASGTTASGLTTLEFRSVIEVRNGVQIYTHAKDAINAQTIQKMWKRLVGLEEGGFQRSKLIAMGIAAGFEGKMGVKSNILLE